jgi:hypothetical protein
VAVILPAASLSDVLEHPLFILLVGAVVTSLVIPWITRGWQNRQRALEIKAGLLARLSDAVTRLVTHAWFREMGNKEELTADDRVEFNWGYGEWEVESRQLQTQLQAYFAGSAELARHWAAYCELLRALHHLSWERTGRDDLLDTLRQRYATPQLWRVTARRRIIVPIARQFAADPPRDVDWMAFLDTTKSEEYMAEPFVRLKFAMEAPLTPLADAILYADVDTM